MEFWNLFRVSAVKEKPIGNEIDLILSRFLACAPSGQSVARMPLTLLRDELLPICGSSFFGFQLIGNEGFAVGMNLDSKNKANNE
jgi:hypothetical protein